jgi:BirA family biotin operon repressor/biotin-[acetyl-CoA-carboxylase] ligase
VVQSKRKTNQNTLYKIPANTLFIGQKLIYVPECHSTNSLLSELAERSELPEGSTLITHHQKEGRGQRGNRWETEAGLNLTFSLLLRPVFMEAKDQFQLNMAVSLAVAEALQSSIPQPIKLKWPNDIFAEDKKIGGILIESQLQGLNLSSCIIGIGINVNQREFAYPSASSLSNFAGTTLDLNGTFQQLLESIEREYIKLRSVAASLKRRYLASLYKFNEPHRFATPEQDFIGEIFDVDDDGRLCVAQGKKTGKYSFREIRFLG